MEALSHIAVVGEVAEAEATTRIRLLLAGEAAAGFTRTKAAVAAEKQVEGQGDLAEGRATPTAAGHAGGRFPKCKPKKTVNVSIQNDERTTRC